MRHPWQVATGHPVTTAAAVEILESGGNAVDAAIAAALAACVAEPLLCSLGGGGYALIDLGQGDPCLLDFFTQTPRARRAEDAEFYPITGNFGTDTQEFHVGMGSMATPGVVAGLFALHQRHGSLPMKALIGPACAAARDGVTLNDIQAYALQILEPIVRSTPASARLFGLADQQASLPATGDRVANPDFADFCDQLACQGPDWFYRGEIAQALAAASAEDGGHLGLADLEAYQACWRTPMSWRYRNATLWSNPPPAFGGIMVSLATRMLDVQLPEPARFGDESHLKALCSALAEAERLRRQLECSENLLSTAQLTSAYRQLPDPRLVASRGTTHISVFDSKDQAVALTLSNGEGSGFVLPGTGVMLNNMLGEEDLHAHGFERWPTNRRMASMMAPTMMRQGERQVMLGSGGSNRIRSALTQVISNLVDFDMSLAEAIHAPRLHLENARLAIEVPPEGWPDDTPRELAEAFDQACLWPERNIYFGGVHAASRSAAAADPRRGGAARSGQ